MKEVRKVKTAAQIRSVIRTARKHIAADPGMKTRALMNPLAVLSEDPYNLTFEEIKKAYDDSNLNIAHPEHPAFAKWNMEIGCILCG